MLAELARGAEKDNQMLAELVRGPEKEAAQSGTRMHKRQFAGAGNAWIMAT